MGQGSHAATTIDFNYEEGEKRKFIPVARNFVVSDLKSRKSEHALGVQGFKYAPILSLRLENYTFDNVAAPSIVKNVGRLDPAQRPDQLSPD